VLVVVGASNNTLGVSPFLFYFLDGSKKHINLIDNNLKNYLVAALPRWVCLWLKQSGICLQLILTRVQELPYSR
jgi:hypothetical protein